MGNNVQKQKFPLKEEITNNNNYKNETFIEPKNSIQNSNNLHNSVKNPLKDKTVSSKKENFETKEKNNISNFEEISLKLKPKVRLSNNYSTKKRSKIKLQTNYVVEVNKYHSKKKGKKVKISKKLKNFISTSKYTWYNFVPKILYEQFSKMSNIYFIIIAILQCFPEISNADGKPIILLPLCVVILVNSIKDFYEDWKRKKSDDDENNRKVEVYDLDKKEFIIKKWKDIFVGNIVKIKKNDYFPADCVLISSSDRKTHNCFVETKNLDGETNLKIKKSINRFVENCNDLSLFQGRLITQMPNEYIYQFDAVFDFEEISKIINNQENIINNYYEKANFNIPKFEFDDNTHKETHNIIKNENFIQEKLRNIKALIVDDIDNQYSNDNNDIDDENEENINYNEEIEELEVSYSAHTYYTKRKNKKDVHHDEKRKESIIIDEHNFLLRGCSLRQTESVICFVIYTGKNTKIMQNSPSSRAKTSSLEKRMNEQIKYIFLFQILLSLTASFFSLFQIIKSGGNPTPYLYNKDDTQNYINFEEYSKKIYRILSGKSIKKILNQKDSIFIIIKNLLKEFSPIFDLNIFIFFILKLGTWCVLMNNLVPISLLMTMELVKYFQGWFISWDIDIYDKEKNIMTKVQTSTLNEELGQVKYIFSDKTGTLTKNYMNFKRVTIGFNSYNIQEESERQNSSNLFHDDKSKNPINKLNYKQKESNIDNKENKDNSNVTMISNKENIIINEIKDKKQNNSIKQIYKDDYGIITNVLFLNDEKLKEDLNLIINIKKNEDNKKIEKNKDNNNLNKSNYSKNIVEEEKDISLNNDLDNDINVSKKEKLSQEKYLDLFMTALSTCHSGIINEKAYDNKNKIIYQASSPDEIAILNFARKYKYIFHGRKDNNKIIIEKPEISENIIRNKKISYKVHIRFEYSSERKSMSIIIQNLTKPDEIFLFIKGADDIILSKIDKKNKNNTNVLKNIKNSIEIYSKEGLRILVVAYKKLSLNELNKYQKDYLSACKSTYNKKEKLDSLANKIENNLVLLGVTGIQDELQDDVYDTLQDFSKAGIKLWVLTGDKKNTAKSIGFSCGLFDYKNFNILEIGEGLNKIELESKLNELAEQFNNIIDIINSKTNIKKGKILGNKNLINNHQNMIIPNMKDNDKSKFALIVSSNELNIISLHYELEILFYELASRCDSVLCCRVSPIQKAKMIHLIQRFTKIQQKKGANYYKYLNQQEIYHILEQDDKNKIKGPLKDSITTLAIGDGANDVNMITSAHIGVGILGLEGRQAARASDYAIGQFKFLKKLLFYHGHESLRKNSFIICYNFYKNFLFVMPLFYVGFYSFFSGQTIYDPWLYQLYNLAFTVFPIIWFGIYDSERSRTESLNNPKLYSGLTQKWFNSWKFWEWIFYGIIQGYAVFFFIYSSNNIYSHNLDGEIQDFKCSGAMAYSIVIIIVNLKVFQVTSVYSFISLFFILISFLFYYGLLYLMDKNYEMFYFGIFWRMIKNYRYYLIVICLSLGLTLIGAGIAQIQLIYSHYDKKEKKHKIIFSFKGMRKKDNKKRTKDNLNNNIIKEGNRQDKKLIEEEIF